MADDADLLDAPLADAPLAFRDPDGDVSAIFVARVEETVARARSAEEGERDPHVLRDLVEDLHESDMGALVQALEPETRVAFIEELGADFDFTALTEIDDAIREEILDQLPNTVVAEGVRDLDSDDAVYILEDLNDADQAEILSQIPASERVVLERSLLYPEESAGRRMQTDFIAVPPFWSVGQTIDFMRETEDLPDTFYEIFVVDPGAHLLGSVPLDKLLRSKRPVRIEDIASEDRHVVRAEEDQEKAARRFQQYNLVSAPVVDASDRLVGVMMVDDILDVLEDEADEDLKALGGVKGDEELSDSVWSIVKSRFPWLFANLLTALMSATVIGMFEGSIQKMVALAVLMPIVASMGGNAGTQTMTVAVRALATRDLHRNNSLRVIRREMTVGFINGLVFAVILGVIAAELFGIRDLGAVIGLAIVTVLTIAALGGILIPLGLSRLGVDPAVSSGPFVTTVTDVIGFFAFLGIATVWFGLS